MKRMFSLLITALACSAASAELGEISQDELLAATTAASASVLLLDVRSPNEFAAGHIPGAINIPHNELEVRVTEIDRYRDGSVVVYCESGRRAGMAASVLLGAGFADVDHLDGDMSGWRARGLPSETASLQPTP
jgi:rhodanese-related sulfurtransferase